MAGLIIERHKGEQIFIDSPLGRMVVHVISVGDEKVRLNFDGPMAYVVNRQEVADRKEAETPKVKHGLYTAGKTRAERRTVEERRYLMATLANKEWEESQLRYAERTPEVEDIIKAVEKMGYWPGN